MYLGRPNRARLRARNSFERARRKRLSAERRTNPASQTLRRARPLDAASGEQKL